MIGKMEEHSASSTTLLNNGANGGQVAIGAFNRRLDISPGKNARDYVDVVTHRGATNILSIANPEIGLTDNGGAPTVMVLVRFRPDDETLRWYQQNFNVSSDRITYKMQQRLVNTSVQVFSKIGHDVKFTSLQQRFGTQSSNLLGTNQYRETTTPV